MADGLLGGLLGDEEEGSEGEAIGEARLGAEAFAAALAADHAKYDPGVARAAETFLKRQARLLDAQTEEIIEQRALRLSHLRSQSREGKIRRTGQRIRVGMQALVALLACTVVLAVLIAGWDAAHDHGLVVEPFSVPPDLAQRGLTGQVVAKQVLDRLSDLQAQTDSARGADTYQNNWGGDLKVEIPETGVSLGELRHYLRDWLGHEIHISGEIYRTPAGLMVTARAGDEAAQSFKGPDADFEKLIQQAAETVYERTQPYRYAVYLQRQGQGDDAARIWTRLSRSGNDADRSWSDVALGFDAEAQGDVQQALLRFDEAQRLGPFGPAISAAARLQRRLGHDSQAVALSRRYIEWERAHADTAPTARAVNLVEHQIAIATMIGDFAAARAAAERLRELSDYGGIVAAAPEYIARSLALQHDFNGSLTTLGSGSSAGATFVRGLDDEGLGNLGAAEAALKHAAALQVSDDHSPLEAQRQTPAALAGVLALEGKMAEAQVLAATTPTDCYQCVVARGGIAAKAGDARGAERWFAEAIRQDPDLPQAYVERGRARLGWGELNGATADADQAYRLSPHYPDALKLWGDALARDSRWKDALTKYNEALKYAPAWTELHQARDAAVRKM